MRPDSHAKESPAEAPIFDLGIENVGIVARRGNAEAEARRGDARQPAGVVRWGWVEPPVYRRGDLPVAARFSGLAILEQADSTTVIEPGNRVAVGPIGNVTVEV